MLNQPIKKERRFKLSLQFKEQPMFSFSLATKQSLKLCSINRVYLIARNYLNRTVLFGTLDLNTLEIHSLKAEATLSASASLSV